jgi:YidC/Oxa1 family membrane protein insertase
MKEKMEKQDKVNLAITVVLVTAVMGLWNYFFPSHVPLQNQSSALTAQVIEKNVVSDNHSNRIAIAPASQNRISIDAPKIKGSIRLQGALIDNITLKDYTETTDKGSPLISLLSPSGVNNGGYYAELGWSAQNDMDLPNENTLWQSDEKVLTSEKPIVLRWANSSGLVFERTISIDENYMFKISDTVKNTSRVSVQMYPYGSLVRAYTPKIEDIFILHEGPLGYLSGKLIEHKYKDLRGEPVQSYDSLGGWMGVTDKYWLAAFVPDQKQKIKVNYSHKSVGSQDRYEVKWFGQLLDLQPDAVYSTSCHFFAGAKVLNLLDAYEAKIGMQHFDLAVDFGWYYLITKPIFSILTTFKEFLGNFGLAILLMTVILKLAFFPLANKSYRSMAKMKVLQPKLQQLQERYKDDKMRLNQEMMELYKKEGVNPVGGCLPMVFQIPVFFGLYKVLYVSLEMRHAPFYGWVHDLAAADPTNLFTLFGLIAWSPPSFLHLGIWPLLMGLSMVVQQKLNPAPADPVQAKMFMFLPIMFTFMLGGFPAGVVIYWTFSNLLTIIQQWFIMRLAANAPIKVDVNRKKGIRKQ